MIITIISKMKWVDINSKFENILNEYVLKTEGIYKYLWEVVISKDVICNMD